MIIDCYGMYNETEQKCIECDKKDYCRDAKNPVAGSKVDFTKLDNYELYASATSPMTVISAREDLTSCNCLKETAIVLSEFLNALDAKKDDRQLMLKLFGLFDMMREIYEDNEKTFKVFLKKLLKHWLSYAQIAKELDMDNKQLVAYHLDKIHKNYPEFSESILIDSRFYPKNRK